MNKISEVLDSIILDLKQDKAEINRIISKATKEQYGTMFLEGMNLGLTMACKRLWQEIIIQIDAEVKTNDID